MTQADIWEQAVGLLGARSYVADTETARTVNLYWPMVVRMAYDYADWSWARRLVQVQTDEDGWIDAPADALRVIRVSADRLGHRRLDDVQRYGNRILLGVQGSVWVEYVSRAAADAQEVPEGEPLFAMALVYLLASRCAMRLAQNADMQALYEQKGREALSDARFKDAQQDDSNMNRPHLNFEPLIVL